MELIISAMNFTHTAHAVISHYNLLWTDTGHVFDAHHYGKVRRVSSQPIYAARVDRMYNKGVKMAWLYPTSVKAG